MSRIKHYASIGALALLSATFIQVVRGTYSNVQVEKDRQKLSSPLNESHHIEVYPDFIKSSDGQIHNLSRIRIAANQPELTSYSYNIQTRKIEGYELSPGNLPEFLRDKNASRTIQEATCDVLKAYSPLDTDYLTSQAKSAIAKRTLDVSSLTKTLCP